MLFPNDILTHIEKSNKYKVQEFYFMEVHKCNIAQHGASNLVYRPWWPVSLANRDKLCKK
jgi:hypothetical protein